MWEEIRQLNTTSKTTFIITCHRHWKWDWLFPLSKTFPFLDFANSLFRFKRGLMVENIMFFRNFQFKYGSNFATTLSLKFSAKKPTKFNVPNSKMLVPKLFDYYQFNSLLKFCIICGKEKFWSNNEKAFYRTHQPFTTF